MVDGLVTPLAGVWIEMVMDIKKGEAYRVTPLAGVWIEILTGNSKGLMA